MIEENQDLNLETDDLEEFIESPPPARGGLSPRLLARPPHVCAAPVGGPIDPEGGGEAGRPGRALRSVGQRGSSGAALCLDC